MSRPSTLLPPTLPEGLRHLFWDVDFDALDVAKHQGYIIGRVLAAGSWNEICWLRREVGDEVLTRWIQERGGRGLSRRQLRFWQLVLELPSKDVDAWVRGRQDDPWEERWHR